MTRKLIKKYIHLLNRQQVKTLNGQIKAGNEEGALKGLIKILKRHTSSMPFIYILKILF